MKGVTKNIELVTCLIGDDTKPQGFSGDDTITPTFRGENTYKNYVI